MNTEITTTTIHRYYVILYRYLFRWVNKSPQFCFFFSAVKCPIYVHCRKINYLFVRALETGRKYGLWRTFLFCFAASANEFDILRECTSIVFILQCHQFFMVSSMKSALLLLPFLTGIFWSVTVYNKHLSSQWNLTAQIEPVQDKILLLFTIFPLLSIY